jgi:hypothetical protein
VSKSYRCSVDQEDMTAQVVAACRCTNGIAVIVPEVINEQSTDPTAVVVRCPSGHDNLVDCVAWCQR